MIACNGDGYDIYWQPVNPLRTPWQSAKGPTIPKPPETPGWLKDILRRFMMYVEMKRHMRRMNRYMRLETIVPPIHDGLDLITIEEAYERGLVGRRSDR